MKRKTFITLMAIAFAIAGVIWMSPDPAFAEDGTEPAVGPNPDPVVLTVYVDSKDNVLKEFTESELNELWASEGSHAYTYSAMNTYPSSKTVLDAEGPTVEGIIETAFAESGMDAAGLGEDPVIEFIGTDTVGKKILSSKLFTDRYCFPNGAVEQDRNGKAPLASSWDNKTAVPAIISLRVSEDNDEGENYDKRLLFGQVSPNEQTWQASIQYLLGHKEKKDGTVVTGSIIVYSEPAGKLNAIAKTNKGTGGAFLKNTVLEFDRSVNLASSSLEGRNTIYYTTDGSVPDPASPTSQIYNYNNVNFGKSTEMINKPVLSKAGVMTIKTKVVEYGMQDSDVSTFKFTGVIAPAKTSGVKTTGLSYQGLKVSWSKTSGATGYEVSRSTSKSSGFKTIKRITSGTVCTFSNSKGLKTGTPYYYRIRAFKNVGGKYFYGSWSSLSKGTPVLGKTSIKKLTSKKKKITISWTKVAGASGYQIYQAKKSNGTYKLVKTITSQSTDSWKTKKLKKKKKYWYKVRAYRTVAGKKVYGSFSTVKYKKVK